MVTERERFLKIHGLTKHEMHAVSLVLDGWNRSRIAQEKMMKSYKLDYLLKDAFRKLEVWSTTELFATYIRYLEN